MSDLLSKLNLNQIPGSTPLDQDDINSLIPSVGTQENLNEFEQTNITEAYAWALNPRVLRNQDPLAELTFETFTKECLTTFGNGQEYIDKRTSTSVFHIIKFGIKYRTC